MAKKPKPAAAGDLVYRGPNSSITIDKTERSLIRGRTYGDLPADHPIVANLIAEKLLVAPKPKPAPEAPGDEPAPFTGNEF